MKHGRVVGQLAAAASAVQSSKAPDDKYLPIASKLPRRERVWEAALGVVAFLWRAKYQQNSACVYQTCKSDHLRPHALRCLSQALLINSANLMGGVSEPDGFRGFGRIHLEMGLPLDGDGSLALFVADAGDTSIAESSEHEYTFGVDADAGLDFRATLSWIDPPASTISGVQLVHDLDLSVVSPSGTTYTMWSSGEKDAANVNERVVVGAADVESGTWTVSVSSNSLTADDEQSYSLVVNGAISPAAGGVGGADASVDPTSDDGDDSSSAAADDPSAAGARATSGLSVAVGAVVSLTIAFCMCERDSRGSRG